MYFENNKLLKPPVSRAAYSDRTAGIMADMSRLADSGYANKYGYQAEQQLASLGLEAVFVDKQGAVIEAPVESSTVAHQQPDFDTENSVIVNAGDEITFTLT